jgi:hypothetical protein
MKQIVGILVILCIVALMLATAWAQEIKSRVRVTNNTGQAITVTSDGSINLEAGQSGEVNMMKPSSPSAGSQFEVKAADGQSVTAGLPGAWQMIMPPAKQGPTGVMEDRGGFYFPYEAAMKDGKLKANLIWLPIKCGNFKLSVTNNTDQNISATLKGWVAKTVAAGATQQWQVNTARGSEFTVTVGDQTVSTSLPASAEELAVGSQAPSGLMRVGGRDFVWPFGVSMKDGKLTVDVVRK